MSRFDDRKSRDQINHEVQSDLQVSLEEGGPDMSVRDAIKYLAKEIRFLKAQTGESYAGKSHTTQQ